MDWNKTKLVFILAFLILDIFLMYQLVQKNRMDLDYISESSIQEKLEAEEITYVALPKVEVRETYIIGEKKHFKRADFSKFKDQTISLVSKNLVVSIFKEPQPLNENHLGQQLESFLKNEVLHGGSYQFWSWNKDTNKLLFFQTYKKKPIYFNESGMLSVQLDGQNRIIGYEQTMLENMEEIIEEDHSNVLLAEKALESLYNKNYLKANSTVSSISLGYSKIVPVSGDVQIFAPTWQITIDGKNNYFVNAIEGQIMELVQTGVENNDLTF